MKFKAFLVTEEDGKYNRSYYHRLWFWNEYFRGYQEYVKVPSDLIVVSETLEDAAKFMGIDEEKLLSTIGRYNDFVKNKKDLDFNRRGNLVSISEGPYYIQKVAPAVHHTMGGVRINKENEVLNKNGDVIEELFAAGENIFKEN